MFILEPKESRTKKNSVPKISNIPIIVNSKIIPYGEGRTKLWCNVFTIPTGRIIRINKTTAKLLDFKRIKNGSISGVINIQITIGIEVIIIEIQKSLTKLTDFFNGIPKNIIGINVIRKNPQTIIKCKLLVPCPK